MAYGFKQVLTGSPRAERSLREMKSNLENFREVGPEVHRLIRDQVKKTFETEGANIGYRWPDYTGPESLYGEIKKSILGDKRGSRLLRWSSDRERLFPSWTDESHPEHVWRIEGSTFIFGSKVPYAAQHEKGEGRGPEWAGQAPIKKRPIAALNRQTVARMSVIFRRHVGV